MKNLIFYTLLLIPSLSGLTQQADQYDSLFQTPQQQFEYITQNLDLSEITSEYLLNQNKNRPNRF